MSGIATNSQRTPPSLASLVILVLVFGPVTVAAQAPTPIPLVASDPVADHEFGYSVDVDGHVAVIGAWQDSEAAFEAGAVYVFRYNGSSWMEEQKLLASTAKQSDEIGQALAISGDYLFAGVGESDTVGINAGAVYVFRYDGSTFIEDTLLVASNAFDRDDFGFAVDVEGDLAVIGAPLRDGSEFDTGAAYVFRRSGGAWAEEAVLTPSDGGLQDQFGSAVSLSGDKILVGAYFAANTGGSRIGKAYMFDFDGTSWTESQVLEASDAANLDQFGISVALEGDHAIVGANLESELAGGAGAAYAFAFDGSSWVEKQKILADDGAGFYLFGRSVALSGTRAAVGASNWAPPGGDAPGKAYVYEYNDVTESWEMVYDVVAPNGTAGDGFGFNLALDGDFLLVGAPDYNGDSGEAGAAFAVGMPAPVSVERIASGNALSLSPAWPNPFSWSTQMTLTSERAGPVSVAIYDILGKKVVTTLVSHAAAGESRQIEIDGSGLQSGMYVVRVETPEFAAARLITVVR